MMKHLDGNIGQRIAEFLPRLRRFSYSLTGSLEDGDDLAQETCLRALKSIDQWDPETRLESWMFRIARNAWIDQVRQEKTRGEHLALEGMELCGSDGRDIIENRSLLRAVTQAMKSLTYEQQLLVALICVDGQTYKNAAEIMNLPIGTVMSRLARARLTLQAAVDYGDVDSSDGKHHGDRRPRGDDRS